MPLGRPPINPLDRIMKTEKCWLWTGPTNSDGYGISGGGKLAHRVIYSILVGPISEDECVLHECDNRKCCNPEHLKLGSRYDNALDRTMRGRDYHLTIIHCPKGHPYDEENTRIYKGERYCRACDRVRSRLRYWKKRLGNVPLEIK